MRWEPPERAWQDVLLDKLPPGVDIVQLERGMRMTFTERLETVRRLAELARELRGRHDRLPEAP